MATMHESRNKLHQTPNPFRNVGVHVAQAGKDFPLHRDAFWELMYVRSGYVECQQDQARYPLFPGMVILHPPAVPHADFAVGAYTTYYLWIDAPEDETNGWPRLCSDDTQLSLERLCRTVLTEWHGRADDRERMLSLTGEQLYLLLRRASIAEEAATGERALRAAQQLMECDYRAPLTVAQIAKQAGVCESALYAHFANLRGQTPMAYLQNVRLHHALAFLRHSTLKLESIADRCGYNSASHLTRHVKAATGQTPGRVRAAADSFGRLPQNGFSEPMRAE